MTFVFFSSPGREFWTWCKMNSVYIVHWFTAASLLCNYPQRATASNLQWPQPEKTYLIHQKPSFSSSSLKLRNVRTVKHISTHHQLDQCSRDAIWNVIKRILRRVQFLCLKCDQYCIYLCWSIVIITNSMHVIWKRNIVDL